MTGNARLLERLKVLGLLSCSSVLETSFIELKGP